MTSKDRLIFKAILEKKSQCAVRFWAA